MYNYEIFVFLADITKLMFKELFFKCTQAFIYSCERVGFSALKLGDHLCLFYQRSAMLFAPFTYQSMKLSNRTGTVDKRLLGG